KGVLRRTPSGTGLMLAKEKAAPAVAPKAAQKPAVVKAAPSAPVAASKETRSLRELLLHLLGGSKRPLAARELGEMVLKSGYRTDSRDFTHVVWVALGKMNEVERAPQGGYRLKKRS